MKNKKIALYMRLSQEDKDVDNTLKSESNSITNQRALLWQYIKGHAEFVNQDVEEFIDDGFSGTNFNRPKFNELIAAVMYGNISCVIVKDFSRFGRNYLETGNYLEKIFPMCQVRFISVNDVFDSGSFKGETGGLSLEVKNLMNALYSRDISQKVTSAMNIRVADGQYMASFTPYGYIKNPLDKHQLIIDEKAAKVVREIFQLAADGTSKSDIAKILNERGEPTAIEHMNSVGVNKRGYRPKEKKLWAITTIADMLKNEVYLGITVWNKTRRVTTGSHRYIKNSKSEWQRIENTHQAIISREIFEKANERAFTGEKRRTVPAGAAPLLYCGSCGRAMSLNGSNKGYRCRVAFMSGAPECQLVRRDRSKLEQEILEQALEKARELLAQLEKNKAIWRHNTREWKGTDALREKEEKLSTKKLKAYEQYKAGKLNQATYITKRDEISSKLDLVRLDLAEIERKAKEGEYNLTASIEIEKKLREVIALESFDKKVILYVIEKILVKDDGTEEIFWRNLSLHE